MKAISAGEMNWLALVIRSGVQTLKGLLTMLALSHLSRSTLSEQSNLQLIERRWGISPALIGERLLPPADDLGVVQKRLGLRLKAVTMC